MSVIDRFLPWLRTPPRQHLVAVPHEPAASLDLIDPADCFDRTLDLGRPPAPSPVSLHKMVVPGAAVLAKSAAEPLRTERHGLEPLGIRRPVQGRPSHEQLNFADPVEGATHDLDEVIRRARLVAEHLSGSDVRACWPEQSLRSAYGLTGYVAPQPDPGLKVLDLDDPGLDLETRLRVLDRIANLLETMHRLGLVHGRVSAGSFAVSTGARVVLEATDLDGVRVLGAPPYARRMSVPVDGRDGAVSTGVPTLDSDRFQFGRLVHQALDGTDEWQGAATRLRFVLRLLERSVGRVGGAPTMREWRTALGLALSC